MINAPRTVAIHPAPLRPILLAGGERELVLLNAVLVLALIFAGGWEWQTLTVAGLLATAGHYALVRLARIDPQIRAIYARHIHYQSYYPARPTESAPVGLVKESM